MKNLSRGVKVTVLEGVVTVDLNLNIEYGKNILETSKKVQEKVKSSIENMTGLEVAEGNLLPDDKRLTKVGKFVRSTSIDELPQLIMF